MSVLKFYSKLTVAVAYSVTFFAFAISLSGQCHIKVEAQSIKKKSFKFLFVLIKILFSSRSLLKLWVEPVYWYTYILYKHLQSSYVNTSLHANHVTLRENS